jgi:regulator of sirC expression with transglutaminase-like and TPR domain
MDVWTELARCPDEAIDLARVALYLAREDYVRLDVEAYLGRLDRLAATVRRRLAADAAPGRVLDELSELLFIEEGFHGNEADYYDVRNSYLNEVLDRRTGLPITLSLVFLEVGWRLGLPVYGVGFPGHFIVGCSLAPNGRLLLDPFNRGALLTPADCRELLHHVYGDAVPFRSWYLQPATRRQMLVRVLNNLKGQYLRVGDLERALRAVQRIRAVAPEAYQTLHDQAVLRFRLGDLNGARADLLRYLALAADPAAAAAARRDLGRVEELLVRRN